jgi:hypothetical protein
MAKYPAKQENGFGLLLLSCGCIYGYPDNPGSNVFDLMP